MTNCDGKSKSKGRLHAVNIAGRIAAMGLAVASAALMATASQCTIILPNGGPAHTITYSDFSPFVYLVAANAIAAVMVGVAIFLSVWKKGRGKCSKVLLPLLDIAAPALLYSSTGAAFATSEYLSYCSSYGRRVSVCDGALGGTRNFCSQVRLAMYISLAAAAAASAAQLVKSLAQSTSSGDDDSSSSSSGSDDGCAHGCKH
uniref:Uncharacterized protein n=1 Tax=Avena sativa TaxID=4498 RepID=A0ACD5X046_AVESA